MTGQNPRRNHSRLPPLRRIQLLTLGQSALCVSLLYKQVLSPRSLRRRVAPTTPSEELFLRIGTKSHRVNVPSLGNSILHSNFHPYDASPLYPHMLLFNSWRDMPLNRTL